MAPLTTILLQQGHTIVALVRPEKGISSEKRLGKLGYSSASGDRFFALPGDIRTPLAGVPFSEQVKWRGRIDIVLHGAASVKFRETPEREIFLTNVYGTQQLLELAGVLNVPEFHYVSTAYVLGDAPVFTESDLRIGQQTRNDYEQSKLDAEELVRHYRNGRFSIYRIPIVVGDSKTGSIGSFTGYYGFFSAFWELRTWLLEIWQTRNSACREDSLHVDADGNIAIPLYIPCGEGPLNLVPIDWVTEIMANLVAIPASGKTFHITHTSPPTVKHTIAESLSLLGFRNVTCGSGMLVQKQDGIMTVLQRAVLRGIGIYRPYILKEQERFDNTVLVETLCSAGKPWIPAPQFNRMLFKKLLDFAIERNFGRS